MADFAGTSAADTFVYTQRGFDDDTISGFEIGKDRIDLSAFNLADLATLKPYMAQIGSSTVISLFYNGHLERIELIDTALTNLLAAPKSFLFNTLPTALTVTGTYAKDVLFGGNGADKLFGGRGEDILNGGSGNDQLTGGIGADLLRGGPGKDVFVYDGRTFGKDTIDGFEIGMDRINLTALNIAGLGALEPYMRQVGSSTVISLFYGGQHEQIELTHTSLAKLLTSTGSFIFNKQPGALTVSGTFSRDVLFGGKGDDKLFGAGGSDELNGGAGDDQLTGGSGEDLLRGGLGKDVFVYDARAFGSDTISGFQIGTDRINLVALNIADLPSLKPYMAQVGS